MKLIDFYNYADSQTTRNITEDDATAKENPCWKGYKMVGQKTKNGKKVPNCVPKQVKESGFQGVDLPNEIDQSSGSYMVDLALLIRKAPKDPQAHWELFNQFIPMLRKKFGVAKTKEMFHSAANQLAESMFQQTLEGNDGIDTVTVDIPLLIRLLEYAREDAKTDMDLHDVAERLIKLGQDGSVLSMQDYNSIVNSQDK